MIQVWMRLELIRGVKEGLHFGSTSVEWSYPVNEAWNQAEVRLVYARLVILET